MSRKPPIVVVDTREQQPWAFPGLQMVRRTLSAGDYSLLGLEQQITIERKSLGDFVGCVVQEWQRFQRELMRLMSYQGACVIVEANVENVREHKYLSGVHPHAVLGRALAITLDYHIPVYWAGDRMNAVLLAERFLMLCNERYGYGRTTGTLGRNLRAVAGKDYPAGSDDL